MARALSTLLEGGSFFEGPRWHDGRWWVSDFYRHAVFTVTEDGSASEVLKVAGQPSGLGWMPDGSMLIVSMRTRELLRWSPGGDGSGSVAVHADLSSLAPSLLNDMVVDAAGRAYVGNFGFDFNAGEEATTTVLIRVEPDGSAVVAASDLAFPNGTVITPDGSTLIVGESFACRYTAFSIADDGSLTDRRVWAQLAPSPPIGPMTEMLPGLKVAPDGCCLDAEGHIWSADAVGGRAIRIAPDSSIVDEVPGPAGQAVFACMLGGASGRTLLLCAAPDSSEARRSEGRDAVLLTAEVDVPHAGLP